MNESAPWETNTSNPANGTDNPTLASRTIAKIPPPPSDIALRTLASDLASMHETGGSHPKATTISINIPKELIEQSERSRIAGTPAANRSSAGSIVYLVAGIVLVIVLTASALILLKK